MDLNELKNKIVYEVKLITRKEAESIIKKWHYSHSINGLISDYCFGLYNGLELIGAMIFGKPAMANQWKKYVNKTEDLMELRRLACIDDTPKNTESYFIGYCLRWLKRNTKLKVIISYADANYGHVGTIYKASNFTYIGQTSPGKIIIWKGKKYHDKAIRTKYKGQLKPFAIALKKALDNKEAEYIKQVPKHIYLYELNGKHANSN